jgi:hypothetical protein
MTTVSKIIKSLRRKKQKKTPVLRHKTTASSVGSVSSSTIRRESQQWRKSLTDACQEFDGFEKMGSEYGWELHKSELNRIREAISSQKEIVDSLQNEAAYLRSLRNELRRNYYKK